MGANYFKVGREIFPFKDHDAADVYLAFEKARTYGTPCVYRAFPLNGSWTGIDIVGLPKRGRPPKRNGDLAAFQRALAIYEDIAASIDQAWRLAGAVPLCP